MARLKGPLFSSTAAGSINKLVTYETCRNVPYARRWAKPLKPWTATQLAHQARVAAIGDAWSAASPTDKQSWATYPAPDHWSNYNRMLQWNTRAGYNPAVIDTVWPPSTTPVYTASLNLISGTFHFDPLGDYTQIPDHNAQIAFQRDAAPPAYIYFATAVGKYIVSQDAPGTAETPDCLEDTEHPGDWLKFLDTTLDGIAELVIDI